MAEIKSVGDKIPPEMKYNIEVKIPPIDESKIIVPAPVVPEIKIPPIPKPEITVNTEVNLQETNDELKGIGKFLSDSYEKIKSFFLPFFGERTISVRLVDKEEDKFWDYSDIKGGEGKTYIGGRGADPVGLKNVAQVAVNPATKENQDTANTSLSTIAGKDFATQTTLALIKAKTDNLDVLLSTRTKPADTQIVAATPLAAIVDDASVTITYVGEAAAGTSTASALWRIKRLTTSGDILTIEWADGNTNQDNVWTSRAALSYS